MCPANVAPVCGSDGITYSNKCRAGCKGVADFADGACGVKPTTTAPGLPKCKGAGSAWDPTSSKCIAVSCAAEPCDAGTETCTNVKRQCFRAPCVQYKCSQKSTDPTTPTPPAVCDCPEMVHPVCATLNNQTYANKCMAQTCAGGPGGDVSQGRCGDSDAEVSCKCGKVSKPVCSLADGKTYDNRCLAKKCAGGPGGRTTDGTCAATDATGKPTPRPCVCQSIFAPVCGSDGITYSNTCKARCKGKSVQIVADGPCADANDDDQEESCVCNRMMAPVCSLVDGNTYNNECHTRPCAGGPGGNYTQGRCDSGMGGGNGEGKTKLPTTSTPAVTKSLPEPTSRTSASPPTKDFEAATSPSTTNTTAAHVAALEAVLAETQEALAAAREALAAAERDASFGQSSMETLKQNVAEAEEAYAGASTALAAANANSNDGDATDGSDGKTNVGTIVAVVVVLIVLIIAAGVAYVAVKGKRSEGGQHFQNPNSFAQPPSNGPATTNSTAVPTSDPNSFENPMYDSMA